MATTTKECSACLDEKPRDDYSSSQWSKQNAGRCRDCITNNQTASAVMPDPEREAKREAKLKVRRKEEEARREIERKKRAEEKERQIRINRQLGVFGYDCPGEKYDEDGEKDPLPIKFKATKPRIVDLPGTYDIVFIRTFAQGETYSRTTKGALVLSPSEEGNAKALGGTVKMHPDITNEILPFGGNFAFELHEKVEEETKDASTDGSLPLKITEFPSEELEDDDCVTTGTLKVLAHRTAGGYNSFDGQCGDERRVTFDSVDEATRVVSEAKEKFSAHSWLRRHKGLPGAAAQTVHDYVSFKPPLAFFFEEGDICLDVDWGSGYDVMDSMIVARTPSPAIQLEKKME